MSALRRLDECILTKGVYLTRDYEQFTLIGGNRTIDKKNVLKIMTSMSEKFLINPIIVNEKLQIIDGQHRWQACKSLKKPVLFVINEGYGENEIVILNQNQKNWSISDFHERYVYDGKRAYIQLDNFKAEYNLSLNQSLIIGDDGWTGPGSMDVKKLFQAGDWVFVSPKKSMAIAHKYNEVRDYWDFSGSTPFLKALIQILKNKNLNWNQFVRQAKKNPEIVEKRSEVHDYCRLFQRMYNKNKKSRLRLWEDKV